MNKDNSIREKAKRPQIVPLLLCYQNLIVLHSNASVPTHFWRVLSRILESPISHSDFSAGNSGGSYFSDTCDEDSDDSNFPANSDWKYWNYRNLHRNYQKYRNLQWNYRNFQGMDMYVFDSLEHLVTLRIQGPLNLCTRY